MSIALPDFNTLKRLAQDDPAALEALRQEKIRELIQSAPEAYRARLQGLQFQIDAQRRLAKNPVQSCINISRMMHDSFAKLREKLNEAAQGGLVVAPAAEPVAASAQIISFPKRG